MRNDMAKVLTERPRAGHARSYHDIRRRYHGGDIDDLPTKDGIRRPHVVYGERKDFTDLLGPLKKFLWSSRGRRWDDVWSDIASQLSNNTTGAHLKGHVKSEVEIHTYARDGKIYAQPSERRFSSIFGRDREVIGLYVHPETGLLCGDPPKRSWRHERSDAVVVVDGMRYRKAEDGVLRPGNASRYREDNRYSRKIIGPEKEVVYMSGIWYWVVFADVPPPYWTDTKDGGPVLQHHWRTDIVTKKAVNEGRYRANKRQVSSRDLRDYGLVNQ